MSFQRLKRFLHWSGIPLTRQAQHTECGVAALRMLLACYGRFPTLEDLRIATSVSRAGCNARTLTQGAARYGIALRAIVVEPEKLQRRHFPFIAFLNFRHFALVETIEDDWVYMHDPHLGRRRIPFSSFDDGFTGVALIPRTEPEPVAAAPPSLIKALRTRLIGHGGTFVTSILTTLLALLVTMTGILHLQGIIDSRDTANASWGSLALMLTLSTLLSWRVERMTSRCCAKIGEAETATVLRHMVHLPFSFFTYRLSRSLHGIVNNGQDLGEALWRAWHRLLQITGGLLALAVMAITLPANAALLFLLVLGYLFLAANCRKTAELMVPGRLAPDPSESCASGTFLSQIESYKTGGIETNHQDINVGAHIANISRHQRRTRWEATERSLAWLLLGAGLLLTSVSVHSFWLSGAMSIGESVTALGLTALALLPFLDAGGLVEDWRVIRDIMGFSDDVLSIPLDAKILSPSTQHIEPGSFHHRPALAVSLHDVSFGYSRYVGADVKDVSLALAPGSVVGITGPTGCGKSTVTGLMAGLHQPWSGEVRLDDKPVAEWSEDALRRSVCIVDKSILMFAGSLRDNLKLWDDSLTDMQLEQAVRDAGLEAVIAARGQGLDTPVTEQGLNFSGGQRQRIELARALARRPQLLIIDEANDALESDLETWILDRLRAQQFTLVIVTHRQETLAKCDRVITFKEGKIVADGVWSLESVPAPTVDQPGTAGPASHQAQRQSPGAQAEPQHLSAVFQAVAAAVSNGSLQSSPKCASAAAKGKISLYEMARNVGMYVRRITLDHDWESWDIGPFIAFTKSGRPLAVIPGPTGKRRVYDPARPGVSISLPDILADLDTDAYMMYPMLPDAPLHAGSLWRAAFAGSYMDPALLLASSCLLALVIGALPLANDWMFSGRANHWQALMAGSGALVSGAFLLWAQLVLARRLMARGFHRAFAIYSARLTRLPVEFIQHFQSIYLGETMTALARWVRRVEPVITRTWIVIPGLASLIALGLLSPGTALSMTVIGGFLLFGVMLMARPANRLSKLLMQQSASSKSLLLDLLRGLRRIRGSARAQLVARWTASRAVQKATERHLHDIKRPLLVACYQLPLLTVMALIAGSQMDMAYKGALWDQADATIITVVTLAMLVSLTFAILTPALFALLRRKAEEDSLALILQQPTEHQQREGANSEARRAILGGHISITGLELTHRGGAHPTLKCLDMVAQPGEITIIQGPSGCGKSTLLRALLGFVLPDKGEVALDGTPLWDWHLETLRAQMGAVWQTDEVWECLLADNVTGSAPYSLNDVWDTLAQVELADEVNAMPWKIRTIVSENALSTGQKQRLLLARQLIRKPRLLILDEATSALDDTTEAKIFENIRRLGITCIGTAHRESTLANADRVLVMDQGRIVRQRVNVREGATGVDTSKERADPPAKVHEHVRQLISTRIFRPKVLDLFLNGQDLYYPRLLNPLPMRLLAAGSLLALLSLLLLSFG